MCKNTGHWNLTAGALNSDPCVCFPKCLTPSPSLTWAVSACRCRSGHWTMRNCIILGCGRSGTSLASGLLAGSGYFMGDHLYPPSEGNPKGYFEDQDVNAINEDLLEPVIPARPAGRIGRFLF